MSKFEAQAGDESANSHARRSRERFYERFTSGKGIDIGCGKRTLLEGCTAWDLANGDPDATHMVGVPDGEYDWVYASHVLEHLEHPQLAMESWWRILKPGGYLIVAVPDEDLYEQGIWPSMFNPDHKTTWTAHKTTSWSPKSNNLIDLVKSLENHKVISLRICDENYKYDGKIRDQPQAERQVELIVQKLEGESKLRNSLRCTFSCPCGNRQLILLGLRVDGSGLVNCHNCGQTMAVNFLGFLQK